MTFDWNGGAFVSLPLIKAWSGGYFLPFSTNGLQGVAPLCLIQDWGDGPGGYLAEGIVTWTAGPLILLGACEADARGTAAFTGTILLPGSFEADGHAGLNASAVIPPSTIGLAEPSSPLSILWGMGGAVYLAAAPPGQRQLQRRDRYLDRRRDIAGGLRSECAGYGRIWSRRYSGGRLRGLRPGHRDIHRPAGRGRLFGVGRSYGCVCCDGAFVRIHHHGFLRGQCARDGQVRGHPQPHRRSGMRRGGHRDFLHHPSRRGTASESAVGSSHPLAVRNRHGRHSHQVAGRPADIRAGEFGPVKPPMYTGLYISGAGCTAERYTFPLGWA